MLEFRAIIAKFLSRCRAGADRAGIAEAAGSGVLHLWRDNDAIRKMAEDRQTIRIVLQDAMVELEQARAIYERSIDRLKKDRSRVEARLSMLEQHAIVLGNLLVDEPLSFASVEPEASPMRQTWEMRLRHYAKRKAWSVEQYGPLPGEVGCLAPADMVAACLSYMQGAKGPLQSYPQSSSSFSECSADASS